jgi:hypothetical protein
MKRKPNMLIVTMCNSGGEVDRRIVETSANDAAEAAKALIEMIQEAGELYDGDKFFVVASQGD